MATVRKEPPDTMVSLETTEVLRRGVRPFVVVYEGKVRTVALPGYYPASGEDGVHIGNDMAATDVALRALKDEVDGRSGGIDMLRQNPKLSQRTWRARSQRIDVNAAPQSGPTVAGTSRQPASLPLSADGDADGAQCGNEIGLPDEFHS